MNKFILLIIAVVILAGAAFSGAFSFPVNNQTRKPVTATASCVDFNPPNTSDTVSFNGVTYDLIKTNASVVEQAKFGEMKLAGQTADGKDIYTEPGSNYFNQQNDQNLIFVIQNTKPYKSPYVFNIYLKDGVPIPSYITNCKTTGGTMTVVSGTNNTVFPPSAFNKTEIIGLKVPDASVSYIYNGNKTTLSFIQGLGAVVAGDLFVQSKNSNLPLYFHLGTMYLVDKTAAYEYLGSSQTVDTSNLNKKSLQLQQITFVNTASYNWWTPSCKPAIYLYPQTPQNVNVKVNTTGFLTLSIPNYPSNGWNVFANPNGNIETENAIYPYLYYESKVPDFRVTVPDKGYVVARNGVGPLLDTILPKLGLLPNESKQFKDYWEKVLPSSSYYFVGIINKEAVDLMEPLAITPKPDTVIRVRLYFEALKNKKYVEAPVIEAPKRSGFTVVEWGGMVKTDQDNPFTCSQ